MELKLLLWIHIVGICSGLREVRIQIPMAVKKGGTGTLNCWYDTEGDPLYAVKWYKGNQEFYRYAPNENPTIKTFPIEHLTVKKTESNATQVVLTKLELEASGEYSCEVSADAPSFHTATRTAKMNVVELPSELPSIQGLKRKYCVDDTLRLNCTSGRSKPAANLTWFINDQQALKAHVRAHSLNNIDTKDLNPLESHVRAYKSIETNNVNSDERVGQVSQIGLQFLVTPEHFISGKMKIRCSASIYDIYWQSTEVSAEENRPKMTLYEPPAATIVGINYLQPPPNFQTGQKLPDGQVGVRVLGSPAVNLRPSARLVLELFALLLIAIR